MENHFPSTWAKGMFSLLVDLPISGTVTYAADGEADSAARTRTGHVEPHRGAGSVLDKGIVIDAWVRLSLVGIELVTVEARVVVASIKTYLGYAATLAEVKPASAPPSPPLIVPAAPRAAPIFGVNGHHP
jgi:hypothetical protein